jgi:DNA (cytosine-5)-methyltransferase 1
MKWWPFPEQGLVLSLFPGIDLLGRGFEDNGYCVVRGPDLIWGGDVRGFHAPRYVFVGVIGGPPCQDFSRIRRGRPSGNGLKMFAEFGRVVAETRCDWFLMENVPGCPDFAVSGYQVQRINLDAHEFGGRQRRERRFFFGRRDGAGLCLPRTVTQSGPSHRTCLASEGRRAGRRSWADFCELMGLPRSFRLDGMSRTQQYRLVGNGVPVFVARALAAAIKARAFTANVRTCVCECGRPVTGLQRHATAACRKRMERRRRVLGAVTRPA